MSVLYIVLPLALLVVLAAVIAFHWAAKRGQFDDLETPAIRALHDDEGRRDRGRPDGAAGPASADSPPAFRSPEDRRRPG